jgi:hypothetical protein
MSDRTFQEKYPSFKKSEQGEAMLEKVQNYHNKYLRSLVAAETSEDRGKVQILQKLAKEFFDVDLLK